MRIMTNALVLRFKNYLINEERSKLTIEKYIRDINSFSSWLGHRAVKKTAVLEYKKKLFDSYAPSSVNSMLSSLNSFFDFNQWYDCKVKTVKIQRQVFLSDEKELTKSEYIKLINAARKKKNKQLYYLLQTMCSTGIRVSELKFITAEAVKKGKAIINCKNKIRIVFLPKQLCRQLIRYIKIYRIKSGAVFISKNNKPLDRSNIWKSMKALCKIAGVSKEKVFPHNLRHLFARTYYSLEKDIVRLADMLGHSNINTTRIYTAETGRTHCKQIQRLGLLQC